MAPSIHIPLYLPMVDLQRLHSLPEDSKDLKRQSLNKKVLEFSAWHERCKFLCFLLQRPVEYAETQIQLVKPAALLANFYVSLLYRENSVTTCDRIQNQRVPFAQLYQLVLSERSTALICLHHGGLRCLFETDLKVGGGGTGIHLQDVFMIL